MPQPALTADELLAWNEYTTGHWRALVEAHPEILALPCDVYGVTSVAELLRHIVAVELRYAQRLAGTEETPYDALPLDVAALFATHDTAIRILRDELAQSADWDRPLEFQTLTMGRARATRKTIFFHAILHSIRHYAQLSTLVRQHGFKPQAPMDYLIMGLERL